MTISSQNELYSHYTNEGIYNHKGVQLKNAEHFQTNISITTTSNNAIPQ